MALWQGKSKRKKTGGRRWYARGKRKREIGKESVPVLMDKPKTKKARGFGKNQKIKILSTNTINVTDPATGKTTKAPFKNVIENSANPHYVRGNIVTKGAIVETGLGKAKITSRPGQDGVLNAVLIKEHK
jgi:small subunit ribosomal protein S8e